MRRAPYSLREKLEIKRDELENLGVIEKAEEPTPWVSPVVFVAPKPNGDLVCALTREKQTVQLNESDTLFPRWMRSSMI